RDFRGDIGNARLWGEVPTSTIARAISAARINLCITRRAHASVYASSSCRLFELASTGAAIVANPYEGIERSFEPGSEVLVVSNGSIDRTAENAEAAGARVLRLPFNLGIGGAVQTGFRYAWEHGYDLAVRCDGDGQHVPAELAKVLSPVVAGEADIAVGSRFVG